MSINRYLGAVALAAALIIPTAAGAQQATAQTAPDGAPAAGTHHHHRGHGWGGALKGITLTDAQKQQLKDLRAQNKPAAGQTLDPATRKANREAMLQKVEAILTPAQRTQFEQNLQQMRANRADHDRPAPAATPGS